MGFFDIIGYGGEKAPNPSNINVPTPVLKPDVQGPPIPPHLIPGNTTSSATGASSIFSGIGNFITGLSDNVSKVANTAGNIYTQGLKAKSQLESAKLATSLERIRNDAILKSAQAAPTVTQIGLPSVYDSINNPGNAANAATPALISGGFRETIQSFVPTSAGGLGTGAMVLGLGVLAILALKK